MKRADTHPPVVGAGFSRPEWARADTAAAFAPAMVVFAVYVCTMAPGLYGFVDTPVFQFVGRVLGTAHNPGYPLYSLLSHAFGLVPLGTLAWRMNLFSALLTAAAVGLTFVAARGLGASRLPSLAAALGFGLTRSVWNAALIAEVYALQSLLVTATVAALVWWRLTRRDGMFLLAVGLASLAGANHTSIALALPALVGFVVLGDPSVLRRPGLLGMAALAVVAGLSPYALVVWRTVHGGAYVHTQARTLAELADVVSGGQFRGAMLGATAAVPLGARMGALAAAVMEETGRFVPILTAVGLVVLGWRRRAEAWLLSWLAVAFLSVPLWFEAADWTYMVTPAWLAVALGAAVALTSVAKVAAVRWRALAAIVVGIAALSWPVRLFVRHLPGNDLARTTHDAVFFDALFDDLPERAALVADDFVTLGMIRYELLGERAQGARDVRLVAPPLLQRGDPLPPLADAYLALARSGFDVRLFPEAARRARFQGVPMAPVVLRQSLSRYLAGLPRGTWVGLALPAGRGRVAVDAQLVQAGVLRAAVPDDLAVARLWQIGRSPDSAPAPGAGSAGHSRASDVLTGRNAVDLDGTAVTRLAWTAPAMPVGVRLTVDGEAVRAVVRGVEVARVTGRGVIVALHERGYLLDAQSFSIEAPVALGAPQPAALTLSRVTGRPSCTSVGPTAARLDVRGVPEALAIRVPAGTTMLLAVNGSDAPVVLDATVRPTVGVAIRPSPGAAGTNRWNVRLTTPPAPPADARPSGGFTLDGRTGAVVLRVAREATVDAVVEGSAGRGVVCAGS